MPFYSINWGRIHSTTTGGGIINGDGGAPPILPGGSRDTAGGGGGGFMETPNQSMDRLIRPSTLMLKSIGLWFQYKMRRSSSFFGRNRRSGSGGECGRHLRHVLPLFHRIFCCVLAAVLLGNAGVFAHFGWVRQGPSNASTSSTPRSVVLAETILYVQSAISVLFLGHCQIRFTFKQFRKEWETASCQVGFIRDFKALKYTYYSFKSVMGALLGLFIITKVLRLFLPLLFRFNSGAKLLPATVPADTISAKETSPNNGMEAFGYSTSTLFTWDTGNLVLNVYGLAAWTILNSLLIAYGTVVILEFRAINDDLRTDQNLYQVPVLKHYIAIHFKLRCLLAHFDRMTREWLLISLPCDLFGCLLAVESILSMLVHQQEENNNIRLLPFPVLLTLVFVGHFIAFSALSIKLLSESRQMVRLLEELSSSDSLLDYEFYGISSNYVLQLNGSNLGITFGSLFLLNQRTIALMIGALLIFYTWVHGYM